MKMAPGVFWGIVLVIIGLSIIFRVIFDVNLFRVLIAVLLILLGIKVLVGNKGIFNFSSVKNDVFFSEKSYSGSPNDRTEYNVMFGKSVFDFRNIDFKDEKPVRLKINTIFGAAEIKINENSPVRIKVDAAFAGAKMPNGNTVAFGSSQYVSDTYDGSSKYLFIDANVVFGGLEVKSY
jgi:predicted membrane protein